MCARGYLLIQFMILILNIFSLLLALWRWVVGHTHETPHGLIIECAQASLMNFIIAKISVFCWRDFITFCVVLCCAMWTYQRDSFSVNGMTFHSKNTHNFQSCESEWTSGWSLGEITRPSRIIGFLLDLFTPTNEPKENVLVCVHA